MSETLVWVLSVADEDHDHALSEVRAHATLRHELRRLGAIAFNGTREAAACILADTNASGVELDVETSLCSGADD